jgi:hypothetical protein
MEFAYKGFKVGFWRNKEPGIIAGLLSQHLGFVFVCLLVLFPCVRVDRRRL